MKTLVTEQRSGGQPILVALRNKVGGLKFSSYDYISPLRQERFEEITDNSEIKSRSHWKTVEHFKEWIDMSTSSDFAHYVFRFDGVAGTDTICIGVNPDPWHGYVASTFGDPGKLSSYEVNTKMYLKRPDGGFVPPPAGLEELKRRSLASMLPLIKAELSLPNSLIELRDFSSLPRTIMSVRELYKQFKDMPAKVASRFFADAKRRELSYQKALGRHAVAKAGADYYLQAKFNILPLLSDISGLRAALSRTERRINAFLTRSGRVQVKHFQCAIEPELKDAVRTATIVGYDDPSSGITYSRLMVEHTQWVRYKPTIFHAECQYNYNYTGYQIVHARLLALLDAVGFNFNPAVIWNAIPWSFIVDWVIGVSRFLDQFKSYHMEPKINIHRYLWSVSRKRQILVSKEITDQEFVYRYGLNKSGVINTPTVYSTSYRREVGLPDMSSCLLSGLSPTELSLGAALVIARRRRPKRKVW